MSISITRHRAKMFSTPAGLFMINKKAAFRGALARAMWRPTLARTKFLFSGVTSKTDRRKEGALEGGGLARRSAIAIFAPAIKAGCWFTNSVTEQIPGTGNQQLYHRDRNVLFHCSRKCQQVRSAPDLKGSKKAWRSDRIFASDCLAVPGIRSKKKVGRVLM